MAILVLGGAGYIGSHTVYALCEAGIYDYLLRNIFHYTKILHIFIVSVLYFHDNSHHLYEFIKNGTVLISFVERNRKKQVHRFV